MSDEIHTPITSEEIARTFDEPVAPADLSDRSADEWATLAIFWAMCLAVFLQFFTRYVLNDSFAWTEEIAIYCLVAVVFLGSVACVKRSQHIQVDFLYRFLPRGAGRAASTAVDLLRIALFAYLAWLVWRYAAIIAFERMTTVDFPKRPLFLLVCAALALMALRAAQVAWGNWRRGWSVLERPEAFDHGAPVATPVGESRS